MWGHTQGTAQDVIAFEGVPELVKGVLQRFCTVKLPQAPSTMQENSKCDHVFRRKTSLRCTRVRRVTAVSGSRTVGPRAMLAEHRSMVFEHCFQLDMNRFLPFSALYRTEQNPSALEAPAAADQLTQQQLSA